ncbi:FAD-dependent 5-carboxymethylaminomethyl-2-thiouridine(34) oxidoreductase MnmC [uncultured Castellaniella sp.]|uniref:FAD-dependent 5-carboxymethylaminomethyl-2-thiouridine(34) oxidoreductase MnmC n=1 Tax=uncultured Castellaniella sp. TaxID=647907 RepID=UPI00260EF4EA|nr:FAD-dependent 5-carboxymethylaminomethyl-2-thiouridine(34) oxidoreductase MnmC [uncultured Castellaniella sp.]
MSGPYERLIPARWSETAQGVPRSERYGDAYHGHAGAVAQARHVFLRGNGLPRRWQGRDAFTICETGFGLGQNFLTAWQAWRDDPQRSARLHYLAFEAHPFAVPDLRRAWDRLPGDMQPLADELAACWPALLPGLHRLDLAGGRVSLTLHFGDIGRTARQAQATVDAFFLDGFAPRVNPEMWTPTVFGQLRRLARAGATAASWCSAGQVRRDLRDAGFLVRKVPGLAGKHETTVAVLRPNLGAPASLPRRQAVAVIGAGLAGAGVAQALALRGHEVQVWDPFCALDVDAEIRRRGAAALVPALSPDDDTRSRLSRAGLERAWARWRALDGDARPDPCGALVCAQTEDQAGAQRRALSRLQFPGTWVRWLDAAEAGRQAGVPLKHGGLWFPHALRACPGALIAALLSQSGVARHAARVGRLQAAPGGGWALLADDGAVLGRADQVVLANARDAGPLLAACAPLSGWPVLSGVTPLAGQVSLYPAAPSDSGMPSCVLSGDGYCLPPRHGWAVAGSTYRPGSVDSVADADGHREILARIGAWLPAGVPPWLGREAPLGWAGWRAATRDHLPIIDAVPGLPGVWLACAYGSRGLSWSALAGDLIAARLDQEPWPIERELQHRIRVR